MVGLLFIPIYYGLRPIRLNLDGLLLYTYILLVLLLSILYIDGRFVFNIISSSKPLIFLLFFSLLINCNKIFYANYSQLESRYITFSWIFVFVVLLLFAIIGSTKFLGHRGDIGIFISLFSFFHVSRFAAYPSGKNLFLMVIFLSLLFVVLNLLQGRTAFGVLAFVLTCGAVHGRNKSGKSMYGILLPTTIGVIFVVLFGISLIVERGGMEYLLSREARLLGLLYWYDAISGAAWWKVLFGHGYGQCVEQLTSYNDFIRAHVEQIINSSGGNCYVSWGFHNAFLSLIYEIGIVGTLMLLKFIWKCHGRLSSVKTRHKLLFLGLLIVVSPNNHIFNHDIFAILIFAAVAYFYNTAARDIK